MAPRRSSAHCNSAGSQSLHAAQLAEEAVHFVGGAPTDTLASAGGLPVSPGDGDQGLPAAEKVALEALEAALAELRGASASRTEESAWQGDCSVCQEHPEVTSCAQLRQSIVCLRGTAREQSKLARVLEAVQTSAEDRGETELRGRRDREWRAALQASQESASALAHDASKHVDEVDRLCTRFAEDAVELKAERSSVTAMEERLALESLKGEELRAEQAELELQGAKAEERQSRRMEAMQMEHEERRRQLQEDVLSREWEARIACEEEFVARLGESTLRGQEVLAAHEKDVKRSREEVQELQAKVDLLQVQGQQTQAGAARCLPHLIAGSGQWEAPVLQVGVSTVAELVALLFGSTDRVLQAEDLRVFNSSTITSLVQRQVCRFPGTMMQGRETNAGKLEVALYTDDDSGPKTSDHVELDETMEWLMGTNAGSQQLFSDEDRHLLSESGNDGSPCWSPQICISEDEEIEWDGDDSSFACPSFIVADLLILELERVLELQRAEQDGDGFLSSSASAPFCEPEAQPKRSGSHAEFDVQARRGSQATGEGASRVAATEQDESAAQESHAAVAGHHSGQSDAASSSLTSCVLSENSSFKTPGSLRESDSTLPGAGPAAVQEPLGAAATGPEQEGTGELPPDACEAHPTAAASPEPEQPAPTPEQVPAAAPPTAAPTQAGCQGPGKAAEEPGTPPSEGATAPEDEPDMAGQGGQEGTSAVTSRRLPEPEQEQEPEQACQACSQSLAGSLAVPEAEAMPPEPSFQLWLVVGGGDFGGIRVREGQAMSSNFLPARLSTGALVKELELQHERLFYEKLSGEGPSRGWVTIRIPGKDLLVRSSSNNEVLSAPQEPCLGAKIEPKRAQTAPVAATAENVREEFDRYQREHNDRRRAGRHSMFHQALGKRDVPLVRQMLWQRVPVDIADTTGRTALVKAVGWQSEALCKLLLTFSARPEWPPQRSAMDVLADLRRDRRNSPVITLFEDGRARQLRCNALHEAASTSNPEEIQALAQAGSGGSSLAQRELEQDLCSLDADGWTPLHLGLLAGGDPRTIHALLEARASLNAPDGQGEAPLMLLVRRGRDSFTCSLLLDQRAELLRRSPKGETALDLVTRPGVRSELRETLLGYATPEWWAQAEAEGGLLRCAGVSAGRWGGEGDAAGGEPGLRLLLGPATPSPLRPKVSVICPTSPSRGEFHAQLYSCFTEQSYPDKELVVVDTGPVPSSFFSSGPASCDERVVYRWKKDEDQYDPQNPEAGFGAHSIGSKRNAAIRAATGTIIAHFDDDDFYGPIYLEQMVYLLLRHGAHVVKLSSFFVFECQSGRLGYCDPEAERRDCEDTSVDEFLFGYGFSYVYLRSAAEKRPFPNVSFGEDFEFLSKLQLDGYSICLWPDLDGICLHMQHGRNTSRAICNDPVPACMLSSMDVVGCSFLQDTLAKWPQRQATLLSREPPVVPLLEPRRRSDMLDFAFQILDRRSRFPCSCRPIGLGPVIVEARAPSTNRSLDLASPAALLPRKVKLDIQDEQGITMAGCLVPWCATLGEARSSAAKVPELRAARRITLRDAHRALREEQLLLGRRCFRVVVS